MEKKTTTAVFLTIVLGALWVPFIASIAGCSVGDIVQVRTPPKAQQVFDMPPKMSLNDARDARTVAVSDATLALTQLDERIDSAAFWETAFNGLAGDLWAEYGPMAQAAAGPFGGTVGLLAGWLLIRRPGDKKGAQAESEKAQAKEDSYNKGMEIGKDFQIRKPSDG